MKLGRNKSQQYQSNIAGFLFNKVLNTCKLKLQKYTPKQKTSPTYVEEECVT